MQSWGGRGVTDRIVSQPSQIRASDPLVREIWGALALSEQGDSFQADQWLRGESFYRLTCRTVQGSALCQRATFKDLPPSVLALNTHMHKATKQSKWLQSSTYSSKEKAHLHHKCFLIDHTLYNQDLWGTNRGLLWYHKKKKKKKIRSKGIEEDKKVAEIAALSCS